MRYFVTLECQDDNTLTQRHTPEANNSELFLYLFVCLFCLFIYSFIHSFIHLCLTGRCCHQLTHRISKWLRSANKKLLNDEERSIPHLIWYRLALLWREPGHDGIPYLAEKFYSSEGRDSRGSTYQAHVLNGTFLQQKKSGPLRSRYRQVSLYCLGICLEALE